MPSRRSLVAVLATTAACNQVFGIESTQPLDARYFDAPPPVCPAIGTAPAFTDELHQVLVENCTDYTVSADGRALARCSGVISEGPVDGGELAPAPGLEPAANMLYLSPRLGPDGDTAVVRISDKTTTTTRLYFGTFVRSAGGTWTKTGEFTVTNPFTSSSPSRNGRILLTASDGIHELSDNGDGTWTDTDVHTVIELGLTSLSDGVTLTGDGLRMIFVGQPTGSPVAHAPLRRSPHHRCAVFDGEPDAERRILPQCISHRRLRAPLPLGARHRLLCHAALAATNMGTHAPRTSSRAKSPRRSLARASRTAFLIAVQEDCDG